MDGVKGLKALQTTVRKKLHFYFCEKGRADGKTLLVMEGSEVSAEQCETLSVKGSAGCHGQMHIEQDGSLQIKMSGTPPRKLVPTVKRNAKLAHVELPAVFINGKPVVDEAPTEETKEFDSTAPLQGPTPGASLLAALEEAEEAKRITGTLANTVRKAIELQPAANMVLRGEVKSLNDERLEHEKALVQHISAPEVSESEVKSELGKLVEVNSEIKKKIADVDGKLAKSQNAVAAAEPKPKWAATGEKEELEKERAKYRALMDQARAKREEALDERTRCDGELVKLKQRNSSPQLIEAGEKALAEAEQKLAEAEAHLKKAFEILKHKLATNPAFLGDEYKNETTVHGAWRKGPSGEDLPQEQAASNLTVTGYQSPGQKVQGVAQAPSASMPGEDPLLRGAQGRGYVIDKDTNQVRTFDAAEKTTRPGAATDPTTQAPVDQTVYTHHSSPVDGAPVSGAGMASRTHSGQTVISNASGHYKTTIPQLIQTIELMLQQGFLLDRTYTMGDGAPLQGKVLELHDMTMQLQEKVAPQVKEWQRLLGAIADAAAKTEDTQELELEARSLESLLKPQLEKIQQSMKLLEKLGAFPKNTITGMVAGLDVAPGTEGAKIREAEAAALKKPVGAREFLRTGGGDRDAGEVTVSVDERLDQREALHKELKEQVDEVPEVPVSEQIKIKEEMVKELPKLEEALAKLEGQAGREVEERRKYLTRMIASLREPPSKEVKGMTAELKYYWCEPHLNEFMREFAEDFATFKEVAASLNLDETSWMVQQMEDRQERYVIFSDQTKGLDPKTVDEVFKAIKSGMKPWATVESQLRKDTRGTKSRFSTFAEYRRGPEGSEGSGGKEKSSGGNMESSGGSGYQTESSGGSGYTEKKSGY